MGSHNEEIAPCLFIKRDKEDFIIVAIDVNDINLFGYTNMITQAIEMLKKTFKVENLGHTHFCLGSQFEYLQDGILLH
jgi:hypothetical protein